MSRQRSSWRSLRRYVRPEIKKFAKKLRKNQTRCEQLLWRELKRRSIGGLKFRRQHIARGYILDFYCPEKRLAIEVDGLGHNAAQDAVRDQRLMRNCRISTLRFSNADVENKIIEVLKAIALSCGITNFQHNPQAQQQQELPKSIKRRDCDDESCGFCGNVEIRPVCMEQVYASLEVAENTARALSHIGIPAKAYRCEACHLVHVSESR